MSQVHMNLGVSWGSHEPIDKPELKKVHEQITDNPNSSCSYWASEALAESGGRHSKYYSSLYSSVLVLHAYAMHCLHWPNKLKTQGKPQCARTGIFISTPITSTYIPDSTVGAWVSRATCGYLVATAVSDFKLGIVAERRKSRDLQSPLFHDIRVAWNSADQRFGKWSTTTN